MPDRTIEANAFSALRKAHSAAATGTEPLWALTVRPNDGWTPPEIAECLESAEYHLARALDMVRAIRQSGPPELMLTPND